MALAKCKECGNQISTKAENCPNCGARQYKIKIGWGGAIGIAILIPIFVMVITNSNEQDSTTKKTSRTSSPVKGVAGQQNALEYQLAVINAKRYVPESHRSVVAFRYLLWSTERKCPSSRQEIADATVTAHQALERRGVAMSLLEFMSALNEVANSTSCQGGYDVIAAAFVTLMTSPRR